MQRAGVGGPGRGARGKHLRGLGIFRRAIDHRAACRLKCCTQNGICIGENPYLLHPFAAGCRAFGAHCGRPRLSFSAGRSADAEACSASLRALEPRMQMQACIASCAMHCRGRMGPGTAARVWARTAGGGRRGGCSGSARPLITALGLPIPLRTWLPWRRNAGPAWCGLMGIWHASRWRASRLGARRTPPPCVSVRRLYSGDGVVGLAWAGALEKPCLCGCLWWCGAGFGRCGCWLWPRPGCQRPGPTTLGGGLAGSLPGTCGAMSDTTGVVAGAFFGTCRRACMPCARENRTVVSPSRLGAVRQHHQAPPLPLPRPTLSRARLQNSAGAPASLRAPTVRPASAWHAFQEAVAWSVRRPPPWHEPSGTVLHPNGTTRDNSSAALVSEQRMGG